MQSCMLAGALLALLTSIPLAWKWQLGIRRTFLIIVAFAVLSDLVVAAIGNIFVLNEWTCAGLVWALTVAAAFVFLAYRFYRDPERKAPDRNDVVVSPADGVVIYIRRSYAGMLPVSKKHGHSYALTELTKTTLPSSDTVVIGISMNFSDVHVNRAPIEGRVTFRRHFPGRFGSLRKPEMVFETRPPGGGGTNRLSACSPDRRLRSRGPGGRFRPATWGDPPRFPSGPRPACPQ